MFRGLDDGSTTGGAEPEADGCRDRRRRHLLGRHRLRQYRDASNPLALRLILDSLRYWVTEMHVDGFRFDLISALTRTGYELDMPRTC